MSESLKQMQKWIKYGVAYGYPECCIKHFVLTAGINVDDREYFVGHALNGSGFVPCPDCAKKPLDELVADINGGTRNIEVAGKFKVGKYSGEC